MVTRLTANDSLLRLIERRHEGPGWQVFTELANGTGARARRRADAVAMALWPSLGMEIHGYECKISRGDARRELLDVGKADAVGKFCDFWWLVVADPAIIDGLLLPVGWGVLAPRDRVLRIVRAAKKRKAVPVDRSFVASMLRSVTDGWVSRAKHQEVLAERDQAIADAVARDRLHGTDGARRELEDLRQKIQKFEAASGVSVSEAWNQRDIGAAVRAVVDAMELTKGGLKYEVKALTDLAKTAAEHAKAIQALVDAFAPTGPDTD